MAELDPLTEAQISDWLTRRMAEKGYYLSPICSRKLRCFRADRR